MEANYLHSKITEKIIRAFYNVYNELGYGFLEKVYENAMVVELGEIGLKAEQQKSLSVFYKGQKVGRYYADLAVEGKVIVELKSAQEISDAHSTQLVNYLKGTDYSVGLVLNFGPVPRIVRKVHSKAR